MKTRSSGKKKREKNKSCKTTLVIWQVLCVSLVCKRCTIFKNTHVSGLARIQEGLTLTSMLEWSSISKHSLSLSCWLYKSLINAASNPACHLVNPEMSNHICNYSWGLKLLKAGVHSRTALRPLSEALIMTPLTKKTLRISQMRKTWASPQKFWLVNSQLTAKCSTCLEKTSLRAKDYFLSLINAAYLHCPPSHNIC